MPTSNCYLSILFVNRLQLFSLCFSEFLKPKGTSKSTSQKSPSKKLGKPPSPSLLKTSCSTWKSLGGTHQGEKCSPWEVPGNPWVLGETWDPPKREVRKIIMGFNICWRNSGDFNEMFPGFFFLHKLRWNKWGFVPALELRTFEPYVLSWLVGLDNYHVVRYLIDDVDVYSIYHYHNDRISWTSP